MCQLRFRVLRWWAALKKFTSPLWEWMMRWVLCFTLKACLLLGVKDIESAALPVTPVDACWTLSYPIPINIYWHLNFSDIHKHWMLAQRFVSNSNVWPRTCSQEFGLHWDVDETRCEWCDETMKSYENDELYSLSIIWCQSIVCRCWSSVAGWWDH